MERGKQTIIVDILDCLHMIMYGNTIKTLY